MNSLQRKIMIGLLGFSLIGYAGLKSNIENKIVASDEKIDFGDINGEVVDRSLLHHDKYGLLCFLYVKNSDGVMSYHILGGDSEYVREFVDDASVGRRVYIEQVGSKTIDICGLPRPITDVDSVKIWK
jgi:hypothetical protein